MRLRLRTAVEHGEPGFESGVDGVEWENIVIEAASDPRARGMNLSAIADARSCSAFDAFLQLLMDDPMTSCIGHAMQDSDVATILADPRVFVASDGSAVSPIGPGGELPVHPRNYCTFPRALALARDRHLLPLELTVQKMTSLPADRFGLRDRGRVAPGNYADLVVLEPEKVQDTSTFQHPHSFAEGVSTVMVNGSVAWQNQSPATIRRHGRALRGRNAG